jgi:CRISP-associated protein Cas1
MNHRTVEISSPAHLSMRHRQLVIGRSDGSAPTVPIEDLALLVVDNPQVTYTHALLAALAEAKVATVICGADHLPNAAVLPYAAHVSAGERLRVQLACPRPLVKRLWQTVVACKLRRQADLLIRTTGGDAGLHAMAGRVRSGDPDNLEAQGAQRYWPSLLGSGFRRERSGPAPNPLLNYGYTVLRAATARALVSSGLLPGVGLFHANRGDGFALASDLMEPFRPFVDGVVWELWHAGMADDELDRTRKAHLLGVLQIGVLMDGQAMPLSLALGRAASSLAESFLERRCLLRLPGGAAGLPEADKAEHAPPAATA